MTEEFENNDSTNVENENDNSTNDTSDVDNTEDVEALKEQNKKLFARAKKAEGFILVNGEWIKKPQPKEVKQEVKEQETAKESYSLSDIRALNDVPDEDVAVVVD
jgi:multidrug efflux pump subunit AcrB